VSWPTGVCVCWDRERAKHEGSLETAKELDRARGDDVRPIAHLCTIQLLNALLPCP